MSPLHHEGVSEGGSYWRFQQLNLLVNGENVCWRYFDQVINLLLTNTDLLISSPTITVGLLKFKFHKSSNVLLETPQNTYVGSGFVQAFEYLQHFKSNTINTHMWKKNSCTQSLNYIIHHI